MLIVVNKLSKVLHKKPTEKIMTAAQICQVYIHVIVVNHILSKFIIID